jgi:hypothetical protein
VCLPLWIALAGRASDAVRIIGASLSLLAFVYLAARLGQSFARARIQRRQAASYRIAAAAMAALLAAIVLVELAPPEATPAPAPPTARRRERSFARLPIESPPVEDAEVAGPPEPVPAPAGRPELKMQLVELPVSLQLDERDFQDPPPPPGLPSFEEKTALVQEERLPPLSRRDPEDPASFGPEPFPAPGIERRGLGLGQDADRVPPEARIDALLLTPRNGDRGAAIALEFAWPLGADDAARTTLLAAAFSPELGEELNERPGWNRMTFEYVRRLAGWSRDAGFDFAVALGLSADRFTSGPDVDVTAQLRLSPYVAIDAGFWEPGQAGLMFHAGWSIPVNLTGATASVVDLSLIFRLDLSERVSFHAGYRVFWVRFRDLEAPLAGGLHGELDDRFDGPLAGLDVRF